jgi:NAD-dependent DNA ligase
MRDDHGQPLNTSFNAARRKDRDIAEMLGLAKGVLADGMVSSSEAELLRVWARNHPECVAEWPGNALYHRLERVFADEVVTPDEQEDLAQLLRDLVGGRAGIIAGDDAASTLPLDVPLPPVDFDGAVFVFTGRFAFGPRKICEQAVATLGAQCASSVTCKTRYVVVGTFGSRDWAQTSYGRKIEQAVELRSKGEHIAILSEDHWATALP